MQEWQKTPRSVRCSVLCCLQVRITPLTTKRVEHSGIKVQLIGQIELASERGSPHDFVSLGEQQGQSCSGHASVTSSSNLPRTAASETGHNRLDLQLGC